MAKKKIETKAPATKPKAEKKDRFAPIVKKLEGGKKSITYPSRTKIIVVKK